MVTLRRKARGHMPADARSRPDDQKDRFADCHAALSSPKARSLGARSDLRQCLVEIGDQVVRVLDPDRNPHEIVGNAQRSFALVGHR